MKISNMSNQQLNEKFSELSTPLIADACLRLKIPLRLAPSGIRPVTMKSHIASRVLPVRHYGSVDIFLEAMGAAEQGDILVIDNTGRLDEGCIGDLTALEAQASGLAGIVAVAILAGFVVLLEGARLLHVLLPFFVAAVALVLVMAIGAAQAVAVDVLAMPEQNFGDRAVGVLGGVGLLGGLGDRRSGGRPCAGDGAGSAGTSRTAGARAGSGAAA